MLQEIAEFNTIWVNKSVINMNYHDANNNTISNVILAHVRYMFDKRALAFDEGYYRDIYFIMNTIYSPFLVIMAILD